MTQVNVDSLVEEIQKEKIAEKAQMKEASKPKKFKFPKALKPKFRPLPQEIQSFKPREITIATESDNQEFMGSLKDGVFSMASMPMRDLSKRDEFYNKLRCQKFLNRYVDKKGLGVVESYFNDDLKAAAVYTMTYLQVLNSKNK